MVVDYVILGLVLVFVVSSLYYCVVTGISPVPSSPTSRRKIQEILAEEGSSHVVDLGGGWGSLVFPISRAMPMARVVAYELSPVPWLVMKLRRNLFRRRNVKVRRRDFRTASLAGADAVVCYLYSELLDRVRPKLESELDPGTLVISNVFDIPGWEPEAVHKLYDSICPQVYVYRVPDIAAAVVDLATKVV